MQYTVGHALEILARTPRSLDGMLRGLPDAWARANEGDETWSPFDVLGHLIHGERTDWIPRARTILEHGESRPFEPFDRFAQLETSRGKTLDELLDTFAAERAENVAALAALELDDTALARTGVHPEFGVVTLRQHLTTWVVHDLDHLAQIARVLATQLADEAGPWRRYLRVLG